MSQQSLVEVNQYRFSHENLSEIQSNAYAMSNWPLVYILSDSKTRRAYVGETASALARFSTHLKHLEKQSLTMVHVVSSDRFNKSATLDIESALIKYMAADGNFDLLNGNLGLVDHNYYQKEELYSPIFKQVWDKLRAQGMAKHSLESIDNSDVFKYSPYKSLSFDQRQSLLEIMRALLDSDVKNLIVEGGAGTGKSVLAIFLFKLIYSDEHDLSLREFDEEESELRDLLAQVKKHYPEPRMALVVPMSSFRATLKKAFKNVVGLHPDMVIGPAELARQRYDIVLVDESHRLRKRVNLGAYYGAFDKACLALGLDKNDCSEVDWVTQQSSKAVFFYDANQSIKPSDADESDFVAIKASPSTRLMQLESQFRVQGGTAYVQFVDALLNQSLESNQKFTSNKYEFLLFDDMSVLVKEIDRRNQRYGLSRLVAGYAWPWHSKKDKTQYDIKLDGVQLRWNSTNVDWINSTGSAVEVGCIHTTQGYDLNYTGLIFGHEIRYDRETDQIYIDKAHYLDINGKQTVKSDKELKQYILNIYRTIMLRGIKGTFVYACDAGLRDYLRQHVPSYREAVPPAVKSAVTLIPYVNAVPVYDLQAAAGQFSDLQQAEHDKWVAAPEGITVHRNLFACQVVGESMNKVIPNGAMCLFSLNPAGSRNGKIVLVECADIQDEDSGSRYTVKEYESTKISTQEGWQHDRIFLKPKSTNPTFSAIELDEDSSYRYRVVGEFVCVLPEQ